MGTKRQNVTSTIGYFVHFIPGVEGEKANILGGFSPVSL